MKYIYKFLMIGLGISFLTFSCTEDFEEINTNPNAPDRVTDPGLLLPTIIWDLADSNWNNGFDKGAVVDQHVYQRCPGS